MTRLALSRRAFLLGSAAAVGAAALPLPAIGKSRGLLVERAATNMAPWSDGVSDGLYVDFVAQTVNGRHFANRDDLISEIRKHVSLPDNSRVHMMDHPIHGRGLMVEPADA